MFLDRNATPEQSDALAAALSGRLAGPLGELDELLGEVVSIEHAEISLQRQGRDMTLSVGRSIQVNGAAKVGPTGDTMALSDGRLSTVLGSPATIGESTRFRLSLPAQQIEVDLQGRSTASGRFSYSYDPAQEPLANDATLSTTFAHLEGDVRALSKLIRSMTQNH